MREGTPTYNSTLLISVDEEVKVLQALAFGMKLCDIECSILWMSSVTSRDKSNHVVISSLSGIFANNSRPIAKPPMTRASIRGPAFGRPPY